MPKKKAIKTTDVRKTLNTLMFEKDSNDILNKLYASMEHDYLSNRAHEELTKLKWCSDITQSREIIENTIRLLILALVKTKEIEDGTLQAEG